MAQGRGKGTDEVRGLKEAGNAAFKRGDDTVALNLWSEALRRTAANRSEHTRMRATLFQNRAIVYYRRKKYAKAIADASAAIELGLLIKPLYKRARVSSWNAF